MSIKITELTEKRFRTVNKRDALGNRVRTREEYTGYREVKTLSTGQRFAHYIIDYIAFAILMIVVGFLIGITAALLGSDGLADNTLNLVSNLINLLLYPFMYFVFESAWQRTPGKFLTKSIVIDEYGQKPDTRTIALRSLIRLVPFDGFSFLFSNNSRGWHDRWSKTWVVSMEEYQAIKALLAVHGMS